MKMWTKIKDMGGAGEQDVGGVSVAVHMFYLCQHCSSVVALLKCGITAEHWSICSVKGAGQ